MEANVVMVDIDTLEPWPGNPNQGDVGAISESITRNGWYGVVVAQVSSDRILAGHHRVQAARALGMQMVPVYWLDCDDATAERIVAADNRTARLGTDDPVLLREMLERINQEPLVGLGGTGYDGDDLDRVVKRLAAAPGIKVDHRDENKPIMHVCPECGHEWAGRPH